MNTPYIQVVREGGAVALPVHRLSDYERYVHFKERSALEVIRYLDLVCKQLCDELVSQEIINEMEQHDEDS